MKIIRELRRQLHLSQAELAQQLNVHQTAVSQWENDRTQPDVEMVKRIADFFAVPTDLLFAGDDAQYGISEKRSGKIPIYAEIRPGTPPTAPVGWMARPEEGVAGNYFGVYASERNMEKRICRGDVMIVHTQEDVQSGELGLVSVEGKRAVCYRIVKGKACLCLDSYHDDFVPITYAWDQVSGGAVQILGRVVECRAKL